MWAFRKFPAYLFYTPDHQDATTTEVEVFGFTYLNVNPVPRTSVPSQVVVLVAFREINIQIYETTRDIEFLPVEEFEKRYSKFKLRE
jgi:hypothetical protein